MPAARNYVEIATPSATLAHYALYNYAAEKRGALEAWETLLLKIVGQARRRRTAAAVNPGDLGRACDLARLRWTVSAQGRRTTRRFAAGAA